MHSLIVGLGNPGAQYKDTWHNLGFAVLDALHASQAERFSAWKRRARLHSLVSEGTWDGHKVVLAKPQTYMNRSGAAAAALLRAYRRSPADLWVVHDEVDLPLGRHKLSADASAAGHKGVQSIIEALGSQAFVRFRLGIVTPGRTTIPTEDYVLTTPADDQMPAVTAAVERTVAAIATALTSGLDAAMAAYNRTDAE